MSAISYKEYKKLSGGDPIDEYFNKLAFVESTNGKHQTNDITNAAGLYQFIPSTWKYYVKKMGLDYTLEDRYDPEKAKVVARQFTQDNVDYLYKKLGRKPNMTEMYMTHFLGIGGGTKFLKALQESPYATADVLYDKKVLESNPHVFYDGGDINGHKKPLIEIYNTFAKKFGEDTLHSETVLGGGVELQDGEFKPSYEYKTLEMNGEREKSEFENTEYKDYIKKSLESQQQRLLKREVEYKMLQDLIKSDFGKVKNVEFNIDKQ